MIIKTILMVNIDKFKKLTQISKIDGIISSTY